MAGGHGRAAAPGPVMRLAMRVRQAEEATAELLDRLADELASLGAELKAAR